ncbi:MAG: hypothetical protein ACOVLC_03280 [Flavobacterium sp.]
MKKNDASSIEYQMKIKYWLIGFILSISMLACKEAIVLFEEPQPKDCKALQAFPNKMLGTYDHLDETS